VGQFASSPETLHVWLGPAIGPTAFEVGEDVKQVFIKRDESYATCFIEAPKPGKYFADIYKIATIELNLLGVHFVSGGEYCTFTQPELFFSFRRDGQTGRLASLIWRTD
jgi:hypothetical protein